MEQRNIGMEMARKKIRHYCAYQERSHREVKQKLFSYGLYSAQVDELITELITENFLNEERYAIAYAGGHFRMRGWGFSKITAALRMQGVSDYCIKKAIRSIDETEYLHTLRKLIEKKWARLKGPMPMRKQRTIQYLMQKGYELQHIQPALKQFLEE